MKKVDLLSDEDLLALLKYDESAFKAFKLFYERYWDKLYIAAYKRLRSKEAAEEIVQDFFTKFWINRKEIKITASIEGYLYTSIKYLVLNAIDKEIVRNKYKSTLELPESSYINDSIEDIINVKQLAESMKREVNSLPPKCRTVFELSRNENKSNREIAAELGLSEKTVENHLTKALKRLRLSLNEILVMIALLTLN